MLVLDTSALMAIALRESEGAACKAAIADADRLLISAATLAEALVVAHNRGVVEAMQTMLDRIAVEVVSLTERRAVRAAEAYRRYGKGWHAASLNYGDTFAYALAQEHACPLLFIGNDFALTDITSALA